MQDTATYLMKLNVLVACEFSGTVRRAFRARGHDAWSCDLEPAEDNSPHHIQGNVIYNMYHHSWDLIIAHPPCTYLTVTGNKWFKPEYRERFPTREQDRKNAIDFFMRFANLPYCPKVCIENPVGIMSSVWRKPDQIIQPFQFGHPEPKKTCLWLRGLSLLVPTKIVEPEYHLTKSGKRVPSWYYKPSPSAERQKMRNRTFQGIADAMASQWG